MSPRSWMPSHESTDGATATLQLSDHPTALLVESYDVVVHIGAPGHLDQVVTTLAPNPRILCASPKYLGSAPPISSPADLAQHRCLAIRENEEDVTLWRFTGPRQENVTVRVDPVMSSNDGAVIREWALAHQGIMIRSEWNVAEDLAEGRLRQVLPDWKLPPADIVAMLGSRHGRSARTAAFLTMLRQSLKPLPWRAYPHRVASSVIEAGLRLEILRARERHTRGRYPSACSHRTRPLRPKPDS